MPQLTSDGQQLLATIEDVMLPVLGTQEVPVGFVFRTEGGGWVGDRVLWWGLGRGHGVVVGAG